MERVRKLYQKFLEWAPENCAAWCKFAELERDLNEKARAQGFYPALAATLRREDMRRCKEMVLSVNYQFIW